jgi:peptidyl-prolyl cis-trans isomerase SurA
VLRTSMKMAAAALAAGAVLTACGPVELGAAAVMTSQRISTSTLAAEVSNLNQGYLKYKGKISLQYPVSQMPQQVLSWLVRFRVRDQLAAARGIKVTPAQVQAALTAITSQAQSSTPGTKVSLTELAVANGLPPNLLTALAQYQAIQSDLVSRMDGGTLPKSSAALQALSTQFAKDECLVAKGLDIKINPQFGRLDYSQYSIIPAPAVLSATGPSPSPSPSASPSASPQLTPAC